MLLGTGGCWGEWQDFSQAEEISLSHRLFPMPWAQARYGFESDLLRGLKFASTKLWYSSLKSALLRYFDVQAWKKSLNTDLSKAAREFNKTASSALSLRSADTVLPLHSRWGGRLLVPTPLSRMGSSRICLSLGRIEFFSVAFQGLEKKTSSASVGKLWVISALMLSDFEWRAAMFT